MEIRKRCIPFHSGLTVLILFVSITASTSDGSNSTEDNAPCDEKTCVRKCCPDPKLLSFVVPRGCQDPTADEPQLQVTFHYKDGRPSTSDSPVHFVYGMPPCRVASLPTNRTGVLLSDGRFYTAYNKKYRTYQEYCLEMVRTKAGNSTATAVQPFTCYTPYRPSFRQQFRYYAHITCLIVSTTALTILILWHAALPKLRDLQGKCLLSHVCSLAVGNTALASASLWMVQQPGPCVTLGFIIQSAYIATFLWLTMMCYDVWRYFSLSIQGIEAFHLKMDDKRRFLAYSLVVWGVVVTIASITAVMHFMPADYMPDYMIRPHFGLSRCFIQDDDMNLLVYFSGILGVLCFVNVCLVSRTIYMLYQKGVPICGFKRAGDKIEESQVFQNTNHLVTFWQRFQIFALMTLVWTTEVLSWKIPPEEMWEVTDLLNTLQGVIIFCIFLRSPVKRKLVTSLMKRWLGRAETAVRRISGVEETLSTRILSNFFVSMVRPSASDEAAMQMHNVSDVEKTQESTTVSCTPADKIDLSTATEGKEETETQYSTNDSKVIIDNSSPVKSSKVRKTGVTEKKNC